MPNNTKCEHGTVISEGDCPECAGLMQAPKEVAYEPIVEKTVQTPPPAPKPLPTPQIGGQVTPQPRAIMPVASERAADQMRLEAASNFINPVAWQYMDIMAQKFITSNALPKGIQNTGQLIMILQAGMERGMKPMESINSFYIVNGKVTLYGEMAIAKVLEAGHDVEWGECNDETATVTITRGNTGKSMTVTFTMAEAIRKGLTKSNSGAPKDPWVKFPGNMLRFKAFSLCAKFHVPDALRNTPIKEDIEGGFEDVSFEPVHDHEVMAPGIVKSEAPKHRTLAQVLKGNMPKVVKKSKKVK